MTDTATIRLPRTGTVAQPRPTSAPLSVRLERAMDRLAAYVDATFANRRVR